MTGGVRWFGQNQSRSRIDRWIPLAFLRMWSGSYFFRHFLQHEISRIFINEMQTTHQNEGF